MLYWYAREKLVEDQDNDRFMMEHELLLNPRTAPGSCPYNPAQIKFPNPDAFEVELTQRIGF